MLVDWGSDQGVELGDDELGDLNDLRLVVEEHDKHVSRVLVGKERGVINLWIWCFRVPS